jgi:hypothetical protein
MSVESEVPGYDYRAFGTVKKIRGNAKMKGVHCSLGVSNCVCDLRDRRFDACRAYVAKAILRGRQRMRIENFTLDGLTSLC